MHKQASVRGAIQAQAQSYKLYIDGILEHNQLKGLIDWVSGQVPTSFLVVSPEISC